MSFQELFEQVTAEGKGFGHRQHVHVTWLAVRQHGVDEAIDVVSDGIRETARYAGVPQKYNATVSRAWVQAVGYHAAEHPTDDFGAFIEADDALLDKRLLMRFYSATVLASAAARSGWVEPDRTPFPWMAGA